MRPMQLGDVARPDTLAEPCLCRDTLLKVAHAGSLATCRGLQRDHPYPVAGPGPRQFAVSMDGYYATMVHKADLPRPVPYLGALTRSKHYLGCKSRLFITRALGFSSVDDLSQAVQHVDLILAHSASTEMDELSLHGLPGISAPSRPAPLLETVAMTAIAVRASANQRSRCIPNPSWFVAVPHSEYFPKGNVHTWM